MEWTTIGIFAGFALGCLGLLTWVIAHLETNIGQRISEQGTLIHERFDFVDHRFNLIDQRFDLVDQRLDRVDQRLDRVDVTLDHVEGRLGNLEEGFRGLRADVAHHITNHPA